MARSHLRIDGLPYRAVFGARRPEALAALALPPAPMPSRIGMRPLKSWRYVGVFGPDLMVCVASVRVGRGRQAFWAVWDRADQRLYERTVIGRGPVRLTLGHARVEDRSRGVELDLVLDEVAGVETVCASGGAYAWTRKQGGVRATGTVEVAGRTRSIDARAVIDDTAAYYERHTGWCWSAGVGSAPDGRELAWSLVTGVNDPPSASERTVWIDGEPHEPAACSFAEDLSAVGALTFAPEAVRERRENLLLVRSDYRQPFGTFSGEVPGAASGAPPGAVALAEGYGVMERHDACW